MDIFNELSAPFSVDAKRYILEQRISMNQETLTFYRERVFDLEKEIETLKSKLHDSDKPCKNPTCTIVDDMYYDGSLGV